MKSDAKVLRQKRWALFAREDIADVSNPRLVYLTRWRLLQTPWFGVYLHAIRLPDADRHLHDHPWSFFSLILKGGYYEMLGTMRGGRLCISSRVRGWLSMGWRRAEQLHQIAQLFNKRQHYMAVGETVWTLVLAGPRRRAWGFQTENGWVESDVYFQQLKETANAH